MAVSFMNMVCSSSTHPYLAKPLLIGRLLDMCSIDSVPILGVDPMEYVMIK